MIFDIISYNMIGGSRIIDSHALSSKTFFILVILTILIGFVLHIFSNLMIKAYPSLSNKKVMSNIHYEATYNQKYQNKDSIIHKLRTINLWNILVIILALLFVFNSYNEITFNDWF